MINIRYTFYLIILLACLCFVSSCTYDYFDDESNYVVYAPKADVNKRTDTYKIDDINIFIYTNDLDKERYSAFPFEDNARTRVGNFNFKLFPGEHPVFCWTNTSTIQFLETGIYDRARIELKKDENGSFIEPSDILLEHKNPNIRFPGPVVTDTAYFEKKYVGRICVAFKNLTNLNSNLTLNNIKKIAVEVTGIGTIQYFSTIQDSVNTRSLRNGVDDKMLFNPVLYDNPYADFDFGFANYYFPSPDISGEDNPSGEPINFKINFLDANNNSIYSTSIGVTNRTTGVPVVLHMNETLILAINGDHVQVIQLGDPEEWDSDVVLGEETTPGGGEGGVEI